MTDQPDLFSARRYPDSAGHRGVITSVKAADSMEPHLSRLHQLIVDYLARFPQGRTYTEIMEGCSLGAPTVCGRLREMVLRRVDGRNAPLIRDSGMTRATPSGRQATVYVLTTEGQSHQPRSNAS